MSDSFILSSGEEVPLLVTRNSAARNISLRPKVSPKREIRITLPRFTSLSSALKFLEQKRSWVEKIFASNVAQKIKLQPGDKITIFGEEFLLVHESPLSKTPPRVSPPLGGSGTVGAEGGLTLGQHNNHSAASRTAPPTALRAEPPPSGGQARRNSLMVSGSVEFFERRVRDEIKKMFLTRAKEIIKSAPPSLRPKTVSIRDTTSRWGSCSSSGCVSLSWRLAFAPPEVMKYVIMHELAHKKHMDHSPAFWRAVSELYGGGVERAKLWLTKHGAELHRYF